MTKNAQTIVPHLWYDKEAKEAAAFYASIFPESKVKNETVLRDTPSGDCDLVSFTLWGQDFMAISAGPYFKFNPSISFMVNFDPSREADASEKLTEVWDKLSEGGQALMPLDKYPFSEKYGWIQDKYGVSWQLILTNPDGEERPTIIPSFMFAGEKWGKAKAAIDFYLSVFNDARMGHSEPNPPGEGADNEDTIMFADFMLENHWFAAMDSEGDHPFSFNESISFMVYCDSQKEIDAYWENLSAVPESEQCGWLKDKFGLSWQIVPRDMDKMMSTGTPEQIARVNQATLQMKKLDIAELRKAYKG
ncbi:VOC family protein [Halobacillus rhizosphaerae]|uniref:VOC family protein n=1 Tax=Halobacillus rhizosphaerae TaxID=3064889 RepID=UPI00398B3976